MGQGVTGRPAWALTFGPIMMGAREQRAVDRFFRMTTSHSSRVCFETMVNGSGYAVT